MPSVAAYDPIATLYSELWDRWYLPAAMPALTQLLFSRVQPDAHVLDVCCGCGHVTAELAERKYKVTGVDQSAALIAIAKQRVANAAFVTSDIRSFTTERRFDAALSTFDSLNHLLELEDLRLALGRVRAAIIPGGCFVFDMNLEAAYQIDLACWQPTVEEHRVVLVRGNYDSESKLARTDLLWFNPTRDKRHWERHRASVYERAFTREEILTALNETGWKNVRCYDAAELGVTGNLATARIFVTAEA